MREVVTMDPEDELTDIIGELIRGTKVGTGSDR